MDIYEVLSHFDNVKQTGSSTEWMATCPCHDDRVRSLCIGVKQDGTIGIVDQAGCATRDVLKAVNLEFRNLFPDDMRSDKKSSGPELSKWKSAAEIYEYRNGNRKLKWIDRKTGKKTGCSWDHKEKDGQWYKGRNAENNCLYLAGGLDDIESDETVIVVEGEKDAERIWKTMCLPAVSAEHGAKKGGEGWLKAYTEELKGKKVYVIQDNDDIGRDFARHICAYLSGEAEEVYLIDLSDVWPEIKEHDDYSDMCAEIGDKETAEKVLNLMNESEPFDAESYNAETENKYGFPIDLDFGKYYVSDEGIKILSYDKDGNEEETTVCAHPIMPVMICRNIETGEERIKLWYRVGGYERELIKAGDEIFAAQKVVSLANNGISISSNTAKHMVGFLRETVDRNLNNIPVQKSVSHMGWVEECRFVPYDNAIVYDGDIAFQSAVDAIHEQGDFEQWKSEVGKCREYRKEIKILTAGAFASPLIEMTGAMIFFEHLWGVTSGTGKTVALMLAASIYGDPVLGNGYMVSLNGTAVSMERRASLLRNIPFIGDEAQTLRTDRNGNKIFDPYKLSEGISRDRSNVNRGLDRMNRWANVFITSGETPLLSESDPAGAQNRIIEIACPPGQKLIEDGFTTANILRNNFGHAGKIWIQELQKSGMVDAARKQITSMSRTLVEQYGVTDKQAQAGALILVADDMATDLFWPETECLTVEDIVPYLKGEDTVDTGVRGYDYICAWIAENDHRFVREGDARDDDYGYRKTDTYGIIRSENSEGIQYVDIIKQEFDAACGEGGFNPKALLTWMKSKDLIATEKETDKRKVLTSKQRINGRSATVVRMIFANESDGINVTVNSDAYDDLPDWCK